MVLLAGARIFRAVQVARPRSLDVCRPHPPLGHSSLAPHNASHIIFFICITARDLMPCSSAYMSLHDACSSQALPATVPQLLLRSIQHVILRLSTQEDSPSALRTTRRTRRQGLVVESTPVAAAKALLTAAGVEDGSATQNH